MHKDKLKVGQRVKFRRSHDKTVELTGEIKKIHDGGDDCVDIETEADGTIVEVSGIETAHAADVIPIKAGKVGGPVREVVQTPAEEERDQKREDKAEEKREQVRSNEAREDAKTARDQRERKSA